MTAEKQPSSGRPPNRGEVRRHRRSWHSAAGSLAALVAAFLLIACDPQLFSTCDVLCGTEYGIGRTVVLVDPGAADVRPGDTAVADVTVVHPDTRAAGSSSIYTYALATLQRGEADEPGVRTDIALLGAAACTPAEIPASLVEAHTRYVCEHARLTVTTAANTASIGPITLQASMTQVEVNPESETVIASSQFVQSGQFSLRLTGPGFELAVVPGAKVYATRGFVPVTITRSGAFVDAVTLAFDDLGSGITGSFSPNPSSAGSSQLQLDLPARYAAGGMVPLRVRGSGGGIDRSQDFSQRVDPLYTVALAPTGAASAVLTSSAPIDIDVTVSFDPFGPFSLTAPGRFDLSLPNLPPGVTGIFLPDAQPAALAPTLALRRTLRLSSDGSLGATGMLEVRATAMTLPADLAGVQPFVGALLALQITPGQLWEYVNSGASYAPVGVDALGIGLQGNDQPAIAWLEGTGGVRKAYLERFDGTTWNPAPSSGFAGALAAPAAQDIGEAAFALTRNDVAKVAFTYKLGSQDGARLSLGSAGTSWSQHVEFAAPSGQHARSPRLAAGPGDTLALSYLVQDDALSASALFVKRSVAAATLTTLAGPQPDGSLNSDASAKVVAGSPALALRADGSPVVAWVEQPADPALPAALLLRVYGGVAWSNAFVAPTVRAIGPGPVQLVVEPAGTVAIAWLEGSPARLLLARLDPASGTWTALGNTGNADGSLNIGSAESVRDTSLALDSSGRLVVAWTEGGLRPRLWVKRQEATTLWGLLGAAVDGSDAAIARPHLLSDSNGRLYVTYTRYLGGDLGSATADVFVARWRFP